jgi:hypothetical protein
MPGYPTRKLLFGGPDIRTNALALILPYMLRDRSACVAELERKLLYSFLYDSQCALLAGLDSSGVAVGFAGLLGRVLRGCE